MAELLRSDRPESMRALARMYGSEQYEAWGGLLDSVRDGGPAFDRVFGTSYFAYLAAHPDASSRRCWSVLAAGRVAAARGGQ
jgi:hypothetical protein